MTTQTQSHTPGPWTYHKQSDTADFYVSAVDGSVSICGDDEWGGGATEANARLIAAAPRMWEFVLAFIDGRASLAEAEEIRQAIHG